MLMIAPPPRFRNPGKAASVKRTSAATSEARPLIEIGYDDVNRTPSFTVKPGRYDL
jgi:hypothetical protein